MFSACDQRVPLQNCSRVNQNKQTSDGDQWWKDKRRPRCWLCFYASGYVDRVCYVDMLVTSKIIIDPTQQRISSFNASLSWWLPVVKTFQSNVQRRERQYLTTGQPNSLFR